MRQKGLALGAACGGSDVTPAEVYNSFLPEMAIAAKGTGPERGHVDATTKGSRRSKPDPPPRSRLSLPSLLAAGHRARRSALHVDAPLAVRLRHRTARACQRLLQILGVDSSSRSHQISPRPALHGCRTSSHRICSPQLSADAAARSRDARPHLLPSHQHFCDDDDDPSILRSSVPGILRFSGNLPIFSTRSSSVAARAQKRGLSASVRTWPCLRMRRASAQRTMGCAAMSSTRCRTPSLR